MGDTRSFDFLVLAIYSKPLKYTPVASPYAIYMRMYTMELGIYKGNTVPRLIDLLDHPPAYFYT